MRQMKSSKGGAIPPQFQTRMEHNTIIVLYNEDGTIKAAETLFVGTSGKDRDRFNEICDALPDSGWLIARLSDVIISSHREMFSPQWTTKKGIHIATVGQFELSVFGVDEDGYQCDIRLCGETLGLCDLEEYATADAAKAAAVDEFNGLFLA